MLKNRKIIVFCALIALVENQDFSTISSAEAASYIKGIEIIGKNHKSHIINPKINSGKIINGGVTNASDGKKFYGGTLSIEGKGSLTNDTSGVIENYNIILSKNNSSITNKGVIYNHKTIESGIDNTSGGVIHNYDSITGEVKNSDNALLYNHSDKYKDEFAQYKAVAGNEKKTSNDFLINNPDKLDKAAFYDLSNSDSTNVNRVNSFRNYIPTIRAYTGTDSGEELTNNELKDYPDNDNPNIQSGSVVDTGIAGGGNSDINNGKAILNKTSSKNPNQSAPVAMDLTELSKNATTDNAQTILLDTGEDVKINYASSFSIPGYLQETMGNVEEVNQNLKIQVSTGTTGSGALILNGDHSWYNGVFELLGGATVIIPITGKIPGGIISLSKGLCNGDKYIDRSSGEERTYSGPALLTDLEWQGGAKDEYNQPYIKMADYSNLHFNLTSAENGIFSFYGTIDSSNSANPEAPVASTITFENGVVYIKGDCSGFRGDVVVISGANFIVKQKPGSYKGVMFGGNVKVVDKDGNPGSATITSNSGLNPLSLNNGSITLVQDRSEPAAEPAVAVDTSEPQLSAINDITVGDKGKLVVQLDTPVFKSAKVSGTMEIGGDATSVVFEDFDLDGGILDVSGKRVTSMHVTGESCKMGSTIKLMGNHIIDEINLTEVQVAEIYKDRVLKLTIELDPSKNISDHIIAKNLTFSGGSFIQIDDYDIINMPVNESHTMKVLNLTDANATYIPIVVGPIAATKTIKGSLGSYKLFSGGGSGCITLKLANEEEINAPIPGATTGLVVQSGGVQVINGDSSSEDKVYIDTKVSGNLIAKGSMQKLSFYNLDINGGLISLEAPLKTLVISGEWNVGSGIEMKNDVITTIDATGVKYVNVYPGRNFDFSINLDPENNTASNIIVPDCKYSDGSVVNIKDFKVLNSPIKDEYVFKILNLLNQNPNYMPIVISEEAKAKKIPGAFGIYKLFSEGGDGKVTLKALENLFLSSSSHINSIFSEVTNDLHNYKFDGKEAIMDGKYRFWNKTRGGSFTLSATQDGGEEGKVKSDEYGTMIGVDFAPKLLKNNVNFMPTMFVNYDKQHYYYTAKKERQHDYLLGGKVAFFNKKFSCELLGSYEFSKVRSYGIRMDEDIKKHTFSMGVKPGFIVPLNKYLSISENILTDYSFIKIPSFKAKDTTIKCKNQHVVNFAPGMSLNLNLEKVKADATIRYHKKICKNIRFSESTNAEFLNIFSENKKHMEYSMNIHYSLNNNIEVGAGFTKYTGAKKGNKITFNLSSKI